MIQGYSEIFKTVNSKIRLLLSYCKVEILMR